MGGTTNTAYRDAFITRVYSAREGATYAGEKITQDKMARALGISQTTYSKYETKTMLPHRHIELFCMLCRVSVEWLIVGHGQGAVLLERPAPVKRRGRKKKPRIAA